MNTIRVFHADGEYKSCPHIAAVPKTPSVFVVCLFVHFKCFTHQLCSDSWNCPLYNSNMLSHNASVLYGLQQCITFSDTETGTYFFYV